MPTVGLRRLVCSRKVLLFFFQGQFCRLAVTGQPLANIGHPRAVHCQAPAMNGQFLFIMHQLLSVNTICDEVMVQAHRHG